MSVSISLNAANCIGRKLTFGIYPDVSRPGVGTTPRSKAKRNRMIRSQNLPRRKCTIYDAQGTILHTRGVLCPLPPLKRIRSSAFCFASIRSFFFLSFSRRILPTHPRFYLAAARSLLLFLFRLFSLVCNPLLSLPLLPVSSLSARFVEH